MGEPLYQTFSRACRELRKPALQVDAEGDGGRYGLSSKEFTPAMVKGVFDEMAKAARRITSRSASTMT